MEARVLAWGSGILHVHSSLPWANYCVGANPFFRFQSLTWDYCSSIKEMLEKQPLSPNLYSITWPMVTLGNQMELRQLGRYMLKIRPLHAEVSASESPCVLLCEPTNNCAHFLMMLWCITKGCMKTLGSVFDTWCVSLTSIKYKNSSNDMN